MTFLLWRAEETEVILGLKTSLNQGCNHARGTMTNTDQHSPSATNIVFCKHPLRKDMQIFNHTGKVLKGRKKRTESWNSFMLHYKQKKKKTAVKSDKWKLLTKLWKLSVFVFSFLVWNKQKKEKKDRQKKSIQWMFSKKFSAAPLFKCAITLMYPFLIAHKWAE